jgi:hypothetical protein
MAMAIHVHLTASYLARLDIIFVYMFSNPFKFARIKTRLFRRNLR